MSGQKLKYDYLPSLVKVWPPGDSENEVEVDIIAVHGLGANPATTWVKNEVCWLSDPKMLPAIVPNARIWTFNFESMWLGRRSTQNLESLGAQLRRFIRLTVPEVAGRTRPIVFVAHSFGGLVVARALTLSAPHDSGDQLLELVKGIVFLGTPFRGSHVITHAKRIALAARALGIDSSDALLDAIVPGSEELLDLTETFSKMANDRNLNISCFYENSRTNVLKGPHALRRLGRRKPVYIVPKEMGRLEAHRSQGLNASHTDMNEYDNPKDGNYILVSAEIREIVKAPQRVPRPKPLFLVPYMQNPQFVGREDVLNKIQCRMDFRPNNQRNFAIWGLGGIGKTQIATRYAYSIKDAYLNDGASIFFIRAATRERFSESYMKLASKAGIKLSTEANEDNLLAVANWLEDGENGRWLMILDNADDIDLFEPGSGIIDYIPRCDHGSILVTTRDRRVCDLLADTESSIFVDRLSQEDCRSLFQKHLPQEPLTDTVDELIAKLEYHPLALTQAVRVMRNNWIEPTRYLELHDESEPARMELLSEECRDINQEISQRSIATTWAVSFNQIREKHHDAADILAFMSFFDRQDIPTELLPQGKMSSVKFENALATLQSYAMISKSSNGAGFDMHGLIQLAMRNWLRNNHETSQWLGKVLRVLVEAFPDIERARFWPLCRRHIPHIMNVLVYIAQSRQMDTENGRDIISQHDERETKSEDFRAKKQDEVVLYLNIARWERLQNSTYSHEEDILGAALVVATEGLGETDPHTLVALNEVECASRKGLKYIHSSIDTVSALQNDLCEPARNVYGEDSPRFFEAMGTMALALSQDDRTEEALELRLQIAERADSVLGRDHLTSIRSLNDYASALEDYGGIDAPEKRVLALEMAVSGYQRVLGPGEPSTLKAQCSLADAYSKVGRFSDAHYLLLEVIGETEQLLGPDHRYTLLIRSSLVASYEVIGQAEMARRLNFEVLQKQTKALGYDHSETRASRRVFERMNPGSIWRQQLILQRGLDLDEESERLIAGMEECSNWKGRKGKGRLIEGGESN